MKTVIWPRADGDLILDLRQIQRDGNLIVALVAVDATGKERTFGEVVEIRDGGGHVELHRILLNADIGFDRNASGEVLIHPENV